MSDVPPFQPAVPPMPPGPGQQQYGQPQYGQQQPYQLQYGAPAGWGQPGQPEARPRTLGLIAMLLAIAVIVLSVIASVIVGVTFGQYATTGEASFSFDSRDLTADQAAAVAPAGVIMGAQLLLGTVAGILAIVLGIVAVATRRGRAFGVVGIVVAALAPVLSFVVYFVALAVTAAAA